MTTHKEELGAGYALLISETDDCTERVEVLTPYGDQTVLVSGGEPECPEDMLWRRDLGEIFRVGLELGKKISELEAL